MNKKFRVGIDLKIFQKIIRILFNKLILLIALLIISYFIKNEKIEAVKIETKFDRQILKWSIKNLKVKKSIAKLMNPITVYGIKYFKFNLI